MIQRKLTTQLPALCAALVLAGPLATAIRSQIVDAPPMPPSLRTVPVPKPNATLFAADQAALLVLGKSLFWDMQAGSDGTTACATCHFHAGADHRIGNSIHPGPGDTFEAAQPNGTVALSSYPFHRKLDPVNRDSQVVYDTNDRTGSGGVPLVQFIPLLPGSPASAVDQNLPAVDQVYQVGGVGVRRVTGRNAPTAINAVFSLRNFWDGRASYYFNGSSPFGLYDPNARVVTVDTYGNLRSTRQGLPNSSLASQAVGPPLSDVEMSWAGRSWPQLGRKMLKLAPLALQRVEATDSVLGAYANPGQGLKAVPYATYAALVRQAFQSKYWNSNKSVVVASNGSITFKNTPPATVNEYSLMEYNFSFFWGLAVQAYEATLISDDTPYDRFRGDGGRAPDPGALTLQQQLGLNVFLQKGRCITCHRGGEFAGGTVSAMNNSEALSERMLMATSLLIAYDTGFYNVGARPDSDDMGLGGTDAFGNPLSFTRLKKINDVRGFVVNLPITPSDPDAVSGSFKTPSLRNIEVTGPYMHNGGEATLRDVLQFYDRGGNFRNIEQHIDVRPLGLTATEEDALLAFLLTLTDDRVRHERAPFDHPQLFVPHGHPTVDGRPVVGANGRAQDILCEVPAVGASGGPPLQTFEEMLQGINAGRAHTLESCIVR